MTRRVVQLLLLTAATASAAPTGLDALDDQALQNELARRDLGALLDRSFDALHTPQDQRDALHARMALLRLKGRPTTDLTNARRVVAGYVASLPRILAATHDVTALIGDANLLIDQGVAADQTVLEYFGPSAAAMNRLRPAADAARQLLGKAATTADALCTAATNDWPAMEPLWDRADQQKTIAQYTRAILAYPLALATDPADDTRDKALADGLDVLAGFDTPDNPDVASVKFYAAKLNLARGTPAGLDLALAGFAFAKDHGKADDVRQQFDARLLTVSVLVQQFKPATATAALDDFTAWCRTAGLEAAQVDVAVAGAKYRMALADNKPDDAAAVLDGLQQKRPELRGLILELVASHTDLAAPIADLSPLALEALLARAETETLKPLGQSFDKAAVIRGVNAAGALVTRDASSTLTDNAGYVLPYLLQKLDRRPEAAAAFLDYVDAHKAAGKTERVTNAFDQAVATVAGLFRASPDNPVVTKLYDRTLATAVAPPLERKEFAYEYGRRLQAAGRGDDAVAAFRAVPADDRSYAESRYYLMVGLRQRLDKMKADDPARPATLDELAGLVTAVNASIAHRLKAEPNDTAAATDRTRLAQTKLLGADIALRERKNAGQAIALLDGFEPAAAGLSDEAELLGQALLLRVQAYVQQGDVNAATGQLVTLAQRDPVGAGQVVYNLLKTLDTQVSAAEAAGRADEVNRLERNRATLTPFLVTWAENHKDPRIRKLTYTYRVFDADTQRRAALGTADPAERAKLLAAALKRFRDLDDKANVQQYLAALPEADRSSLQYDPQVRFGLARTLYAQGDWTAARQELATLFRDKALGNGTTTEIDAAGTVQQQDNPSYWEALLELARCNLKLNENVAGMKELVAEQAVLYGDGLGGKQWHAAFAALRSELDAASPATGPS